MERPQKRLQRLAGFVKSKSGLHVPVSIQHEMVVKGVTKQAEEKLRREAIVNQSRKPHRPWYVRPKRLQSRKHKTKLSRKANRRRLRQNKRRTWQNAK